MTTTYLNILTFIFLTIIAVYIARVLSSPSDGTHRGQNQNNGTGKQNTSRGNVEAPERRAGREGELIAKKHISRNLVKGDILVNNITLMYDGKPTEIDNLIISKYGVFIVEVKNYVGELKGGENDFEWVKSKKGMYTKMVRNPLKQVDRQVYILANFLRSKGINVWVDGYVYFVNNNSPVNSRRVLRSSNDIYANLHPAQHNPLSDYTISKIQSALGCGQQYSYGYVS